MSLRGADKRKFLQEKLEEQRHFLAKSLNDLTSGDLAEAVRIAALLRTLVHESGSSKPLLKQLISNYLELEILDRIPMKKESPPQGQQAIVVMSIPISFRITDRGVFLNKALDLEAYAPSIVGRWWERPCLILPGLGGISRRETTLGMANKEGGAHVDAQISKRYQQLLECKSFRVGNSQETTSPLSLSRLMVGQSGIEMLECINKRFPPAC